jgi:hypothetical protein
LLQVLVYKSPCLQKWRKNGPPKAGIVIALIFRGKEKKSRDEKARKQKEREPKKKIKIKIK